MHQRVLSYSSDREKEEKECDIICYCQKTSLYQRLGPKPRNLDLYL